MAQTRIRPEQVRLDLDWSFAGHVAIGEDGVIAATRLLDIDGVTTGFGAVLTPSMEINSPLFYGLYTRVETEVAAITITDAISLFVDDAIKGAGSTLTNLYGLCIEDLTQGTARNWAICIRGDDPIVWGNDTEITRLAANVLYTPDDFHCAQEVRTGNGLVGTPAYSFISDVDTGMYRIGVNDLGFTTNSTLALELNAVQQALVTNGTAAAPGFAFISDPDTGLYRIGANRLGITTAGAFAVEIDALGRIGIHGAPACDLHIWGATDPHMIIQDTTNNVQVYFQAENTHGRFGTLSNHDLQILTNSAIVVMIDNTGGVFMYALKAGANQAAAGAAVDELWHDTDDDSIKIGV